MLDLGNLGIHVYKLYKILSDVDQIDYIPELVLLSKRKVKPRSKTSLIIYFGLLSRVNTRLPLELMMYQQNNYLEKS